MRGLGFSAHGGLDKVGWVDVPPPEPGPGEVRVRVHAAAFNRLDRFVLEGIPGVPVALPHVLGSDASGVVDRVGDGVTEVVPGAEVLVNPGLWDGTCEYCRVGQESLCRNYRILGEHTQGSATEFVVVPPRNIYAKPPAWSWAQAAAAPLVFQTAWRALRTVGDVRPGETVAIIGAGGAVAPAAIQVAHRLGARVVVVGRTAEKVERAVALGAEAGLVVKAEKSHERLLWEWSNKRGIDVIFDSAGADTVPRSLRALARGGDWSSSEPRKARKSNWTCGRFSGVRRRSGGAPWPAGPSSMRSTRNWRGDACVRSWTPNGIGTGGSKRSTIWGRPRSSERWSSGPSDPVADHAGRPGFTSAGRCRRFCVGFIFIPGPSNLKPTDRHRSICVSGNGGQS